MQGAFEDINGVWHWVRISGSGSDEVLKFGASPFVTQMDGGDDTIYKPAKYQGATIGLIASGSDYLFNLYTGDAKGIAVTLTNEEGDVEWVGYVTPSLYNIGYVTADEPLSVDCIDGLSVLQYYKYEPIGASSDIQGLLDIVTHCVKKCGCYAKLVVDQSTWIPHAGGEAPILGGAYISEDNFIDQSAQDDDEDETMTYKDVLEAICRWACVTAVAKGDTVYLIDYDSVKMGNVPTLTINLTTGSKTTSTRQTARHIIYGDTYATSETSLSLDNVYNKVTVKDEADDYDAMLVDVWEDAENITKTDQGIIQPYVSFQRGEFIDTGNDKMLVFVGLIWSQDAPPVPVAANAVAVKYYKSPYYKTYKYQGSGAAATTRYDDANSYYDTRIANGAWIVRAYVHNLENLGYVKEWLDDKTSGADSVDAALVYNDVSSLDFDEYIFLTNCGTHGTPHINNDAAESRPYLETVADVTRSSLFGGDNAFLLIEGEVMFHNDPDTMYPIPIGEVDITFGKTAVNKANAYLLAKLTWGEWCWTGTQWSKNAVVTFQIPLLKENKRADDFFFKSNGIINTVTWRLGTDKRGYLIPMPEGDALVAGAPHLTLYKPMDFMTVSGSQTTFMALKNFKISPIIADPTFSDALDTDTIYSNVINKDNAQELDEITLDVVTYDDKHPTHSAVAWLDGSEFKWVDRTYNRATAQGEMGIVRYDGSVCDDGMLRQEEHIIYRHTNQYSSPAKVLELTLNTNSDMRDMWRERNLDTDFIIDAVGVDYRAQEYKYKLIEKK